MEKRKIGSVYLLRFKSDRANLTNQTNKNSSGNLKNERKKGGDTRI